MDKVLVADVYHLHDSAIIKLDANSSLEDAIGMLARNPTMRGIFLVDSKQRFAGMITKVDLLRWAMLNLTGGTGRHSLGVAEIFRIVDARKVSDLTRGSQKSFSITESDTLQAALNKMLDIEEDVIAVLDSEGKVLGDLRLSEVLSWIINSGKRAI